jgi:hypothetical protein
MNVVKHVVVAVTIVVLFGGTILAVYDRAHYLGSLDGYAVGYKAALNTREPSDELEMACAGLWVGEQHKKYEERQHGKR